MSLTLNECVHDVKEAALMHQMTLTYQDEMGLNGKIMMLYFSQVLRIFTCHFLEVFIPQEYSNVLLYSLLCLQCSVYALYL